MDEAKLDAFLTVARGLNALGITPLLCGSLGLELVTGRDWRPGDIDVLVPGDPRGWEAPDEDRIDDWDAIHALMTGLGYRLVDLHEHELEDASGLRLQIGALDTLPEFAGIPLDAIRRHDDPRADYLLLDAEQYLALYEASSLDGYRADEAGHKDQPKVAYLRALLGRDPAG